MTDWCGRWRPLQVGVVQMLWCVGVGVVLGVLLGMCVDERHHVGLMSRPWDHHQGNVAMVNTVLFPGVHLGQGMT